jgi:hypothetical protein
MLSFKEISPLSRIWIYQCRTELSPDTVTAIRNRADIFLADWTSHGHKMDAALDVFYNRFVILALDEKTASASGCGIDKSIRFIQEIEKEFGITLLDRMDAAWEQDGQIKTGRLKEFETLLHTGQLNKHTIIFNNLVETKDQLVAQWRIPVEQSWHARLLKS